MFYIAHKDGLVGQVVVKDGRISVYFTNDLRRAYPFLSYKDAEELMAKVSGGKYFGILKTTEGMNSDSEVPTCVI